MDPSIDPVERIRITMEEVAHSISLTTITTVFAFLLGLLSSLPGVQWLCLCEWLLSHESPAAVIHTPSSC